MDGVHSSTHLAASLQLQVAAVFAYIQSVAAFDSSDSHGALNCFTAFVRIFMPCFYDGESSVDGEVLLAVFVS